MSVPDDLNSYVELEESEAARYFNVALYLSHEIFGSEKLIPQFCFTPEKEKRVALGVPWIGSNYSMPEFSFSLLCSNSLLQRSP